MSDLVAGGDDLVEIAPGLRTAVRDEGTGPAVVLLHGTPLDLRAWDGVVAAMGGSAAPRRVLRCDARGHGSATAVPVAEYARLASDVVALLDHLDVADAHVVGHSWGGQIAQQVALDHPDRVSRLSLVCTRASPFPAFVPVAEGLRHGTGDRTASLARWFSPEELAAEGPVVVATRAWLAGADARNWADALEMVAAFDVLERLRHVVVPTDVVAAELDGVAVPEHMARIAEAVPHATWRLLPGARHLAPLQHADAIAQLLAGRQES